jgi:hypothetical protein
MNKPKYRLETWKKTQWKGTARQQQTTVQRLVKRDTKGHFMKGTPVIKEVREKSYGTGQYKVGVVNGKIVARLKIAKKPVQWYDNRKEVIANRKMYRTSYVLNDIPFRGNVYYGFRIIAFSHNLNLLKNIRGKLKERLIEFIEKCISYRRDEFWFDMYFGYEAPSLNNAFKTEDGKYYLMWQKRYGTSIKEETHNLTEIT